MNILLTLKETLPQLPLDIIEYEIYPFLKPLFPHSFYKGLYRIVNNIIRLRLEGVKKTRNKVISEKEIMNIDNLFKENVTTLLTEIENSIIYYPRRPCPELRTSSDMRLFLNKLLHIILLPELIKYIPCDNIYEMTQHQWYLYITICSYFNSHFSDIFEALIKFRE